MSHTLILLDCWWIFQMLLVVLGSFTARDMVELESKSLRSAKPHQSSTRKDISQSQGTWVAHMDDWWDWALTEVPQFPEGPHGQPLKSASWLRGTEQCYRLSVSLYHSQIWLARKQRKQDKPVQLLCGFFLFSSISPAKPGYSQDILLSPSENHAGNWGYVGMGEKTSL